MPGLQQRLQVAHIELSPQTKKELDERFVLIYTGQRRLARNLLRDVVGRYVGNEPDSLFALEGGNPENSSTDRLLHNHTYSCISQMRRYRSNLQALFLVHPAAFIQVAVDQKQEYNC